VASTAGYVGVSLVQFHLAHAADGTSAGMRPRRRAPKRWTPPPSLQWVLDRFTAPAIVRNGRMDLLATNHLGRAMHAALYDSSPGGTPRPERVGFDDLPVVAWVDPPLTTVHQPLTEMAVAATELAMSLGRGEKAPQIGLEIATTLTVRISTAPPGN
jgi:hypothetical protein